MKRYLLSHVNPWGTLSCQAFLCRDDRTAVGKAKIMVIDGRNFSICRVHEAEPFFVRFSV